MATAGGGAKKGDGEQEGGRLQKKRRLSPSSITKDGEVNNSWQNTPPFSTNEPFTPPVKNPIPRVSADSLSIEAFQSHLAKPRPDRGPGPAPLIITGLVDHWPALTTHHWNKPAYLLSRTLSGRRLVPVEIGRSYVDEGWGQKIISFGEFLSKYIDASIPFTLPSSNVSPFLSSSSSSLAQPQPQSSPSSNSLPPEKDNPKTNSQIAYLAQHPLFLQLPRLRQDILTPDLCYTAPPSHPTDPSQDQPELDSPQLNAWFGPPGTITPLHTDPYHNLLVQVVGRKYVRLYGPEETGTGRMRPRGKEGGVEMGNTSEVDLGVVEGWDKLQGDGEGREGGEDENEGEAWEEDFKKVPFVDCILEPGDALYIPIGWWHYVRGLSAESLSLIALSAACVAVLANTFQGDGYPLIASFALSGLAFSATFSMIRWLGPTFMKAGLKGVDMSKHHKKELPECMGGIAAIVYLLAVIVFIPFPFYKDIVAATSGGGNRDVVMHVEHVQEGRFLHRFPHGKLASYLSAVMALQSISLLGIGDDLFDIRWRHKFFIPAFASIPLLVVYFVDFGVTSVVIPLPLQPYLGELFNLGALYYVYMASVAIFSPNSINILAGINGIEVTQSIVIAMLLAFNDCLYLLTPSGGPFPHPATDSHLFSLYFLLPFLGVSFALLWHNWYPARVFVGDTYCYFAGMVFVVVSILGHFSKTLILLLIPQIFNFVYSVPQLFGLVPCPRHRLPRFNARTGLLEPSVTSWTPERQPKPLIAWGLKTLDKLRLLRVTLDEEGRFVETSNFTILNLWLVWRGPLREDRLAMEITGMQVVVGLFGLFVRHRLALIVFKQ
ncbi:unnamed protein product [Sordaria macrospora k-hell]|uniref:UDP-N-acetylglucosamine--dolichyl-phosphate N-acetylglucosaminephosphotransferase n=1 Tax=Sordaria macrospora (strain ATCC MYA-333 / DSM 997 / K(L3346) / K-hell) TaxID=771870 RepID=F7VRT5_SORMK|nr:uncharacterized protein SMAC_01769 [Sordaria macrospora k-hell]CCC08221.1 unnamed protein product [Sordaria macrospora k-hell]